MLDSIPSHCDVKKRDKDFNQTCTVSITSQVLKYLLPEQTWAQQAKISSESTAWVELLWFSQPRISGKVEEELVTNWNQTTSLTQRNLLAWKIMQLVWFIWMNPWLKWINVVEWLRTVGFIMKNIQCITAECFYKLSAASLPTPIYLCSIV